jgi:hypothetical protein
MLICALLKIVSPRATAVRSLLTPPVPERLVRDHDPERQFQSHARPMYLIKINVL